MKSNNTVPPKSAVLEVHNKIQKSKNPNLLTSACLEFQNEGLIHFLVFRLKKPEALAYAVCREKDIIIDGIDCKNLAPVNLDVRGAQGKTALELLESELLIPQTQEVLAKLNLLKRILQLAKEGSDISFNKISDISDNL